MDSPLKFKERLNKILDRLVSDDLLNNSGLGNEIGFYIFDYPPEHEPEMREHIEFLLRQIPKRRPNIRLAHVNLFDLIIQHLQQRNLLDRVHKIQKEKGDQHLLKSLKGPLDPKKIAAVFIEMVQPSDKDLVLVSGVGSAYPLLRSHNLLNNLHAWMEDTPLVMFYPGVYTGQGMKLFGKLKESNYYRAFRLII
jgi:hypothetical protein